MPGRSGRGWSRVLGQAVDPPVADPAEDQSERLVGWRRPWATLFASFPRRAKITPLTAPVIESPGARDSLCQCPAQEPRSLLADMPADQPWCRIHGIARQSGLRARLHILESGHIPDLGSDDRGPTRGGSRATAGSPCAVPIWTSLVSWRRTLATCQHLPIASRIWLAEACDNRAGRITHLTPNSTGTGPVRSAGACPASTRDPVRDCGSDDSAVCSKSNQTYCRNVMNDESSVLLYVAPQAS